MLPFVIFLYGVEKMLILLQKLWGSLIKNNKTRQANNIKIVAANSYCRLNDFVIQECI